MLNSDYPAVDPGNFALQLREKSREIPATPRDGQFSAEMLGRTDGELLNYWEECKRLTCTPEVRGWYQEVYKHRFQGLEVADVGPGVGLDGVFFAEHGAHITFVDIVEENLKLLERICRLKGIAADFYFVDDFFNYRFRRKFHAFWAVGSLINAPFDFTRQRVAAMTKFLRVGGKVAMLGYPRERYLHLGVKNGEQFGKRTDGERTPWCEWYDDDKIRALFGQDFHLEWSRNFGSDSIEFNWFEFTKLRDAKTTRNTPLPSVWVRKAEIQVCSDHETTAVVSGTNGSANGRIASANSAAADLLFNQPYEPASPNIKAASNRFLSASNQVPALAKGTFAQTSRTSTLVSAVPVADLHRQLGFKAPLEYPQSSQNKPFTQWRMETDDAPIFRYIYREAQPRRHLEFGTWQGEGTVYCLEETKASVWTVNLPFGENPQAEAAYGHYSEDLPALHAWAEKIGLPLKQSYRTDTLGFIGRLYLEKGLGHRVNQIYADSTKWDISNLPPGFFDTILIDGAHSQQVVRSDTRKALQLLRPGGLLMWHDFCPPVYNQCPSTQGVCDALAAQWDWLQTQMSCLFWIYPSWILVGVKKETVEEPFIETLHPVNETERTAEFKEGSQKIPTGESTPDDLALRARLGTWLGLTEPVTVPQLMNANETLNLILGMPQPATYLAQSRTQVSPIVIPLLMERLESAEKNGDAARAGQLREVYYEVILK